MGSAPRAVRSAGIKQRPTTTRLKTYTVDFMCHIPLELLRNVFMEGTVFPEHTVVERNVAMWIGLLRNGLLGLQNGWVLYCKTRSFNPHVIQLFVKGFFPAPDVKLFPQRGQRKNRLHIQAMFAVISMGKHKPRRIGDQLACLAAPINPVISKRAEIVSRDRAVQ